jgi:hypothetical protein
MIAHFSVSEVEELFTTYDYKRLIKAVEEHFNECAKNQGLHTTATKAYYNPEENEGIVCFEDTYEYIYLEPLQLAYGIDFITIKFK